MAAPQAGSVGRLTSETPLCGPAQGLPLRRYREHRRGGMKRPTKAAADPPKYFVQHFKGLQKSYKNHIYQHTRVK